MVASPNGTSALIALGRIRSLLLSWYGKQDQAFPWRGSRDPYLALVAAVCAQQTQIARVVPIYERWTAAFPTIASVAAAARAEVLRVWADAGYPRRAVYLHQTAAICLERHRGQVPRDHDELLALPGVGPFTAAIVASFGFGDDVPAVDTNVMRVIGRLICGDLQPTIETPRRSLDAVATRLLRPGTAAQWNPTLMDYGARICTPRPQCDRCVVRHLCAAHPRFAAGEVALPVRAQGRFADSDRYWRGRLMQLLRDHDERGTAPRETAELIGELSPHPETRARLDRLLAGLVSDGLAWTGCGRAGLGLGES